MATEDDIIALRLKIDEPKQDTYDDDELDARLEAAGGNQNKVAYDIWSDKAASLASLVTVSESGSSRNMGDLSKNALSMAEHFRRRAADDSAGEDPAVPASARARTRAIVRP